MDIFFTNLCIAIVWGSGIYLVCSLFLSVVFVLCSIMYSLKEDDEKLETPFEFPMRTGTNDTLKHLGMTLTILCVLTGSALYLQHFHVTPWFLIFTYLLMAFTMFKAFVLYMIVFATTPVDSQGFMIT